MPELARRFSPGPRRLTEDRSRGPTRPELQGGSEQPAGTGGKANCLCLWGIWETPKPRYREETKPVSEVAWGHFVPEEGSPSSGTLTFRADRTGTSREPPRRRRCNRGTFSFRRFPMKAKLLVLVTLGAVLG